MIHEVNHALNGDGVIPPGSFERYKAEFRAFWVSTSYARAFANDDEKAEQIKLFILSNPLYKDLASAYHNTRDTTFRDRVDNHKRPSGNLTNELKTPTNEQANP